MTSRFAGRRAVVTGGALGMGRATVETLLAEGAQVAVVDQNADALEALGNEVANEHLNTQVADVRDEAAYEAALQDALITLGERLDIMVHIAGASRGGLVARQSSEDWDWHYATNLRSHVISCRFAARAMTSGGAVVNMSSISGLRGDPGWAAYNATKAAIKSLTESFAHEVGHLGIRVNAVCPGPVSSERMLASLGDDDDMVPRYCEATALGRLVEPDEVAAAILFLASDAASAITGHALVVDCGLTSTTGQPVQASVLDG